LAELVIANEGSAGSDVSWSSEASLAHHLDDPDLSTEWLHTHQFQQLAKMVSDFVLCWWQHFSLLLPFRVAINTTRLPIFLTSPHWISVIAVTHQLKLDDTN
jgi:hypothetical protein